MVLVCCGVVVGFKVRDVDVVVVLVNMNRRVFLFVDIGLCFYSLVKFVVFSEFLASIA